jgi:hypothetical protein
MLFNKLVEINQILLNLIMLFNFNCLLVSFLDNLLPLLFLDKLLNFVRNIFLVLFVH